MNAEKVTKGQFFTKAQIWLKPQIIDFIKNSNCDLAYDPYAGAGDLLKCSHMYFLEKTKGLDADKKLGWEYNDSLVKIPHIDGAIIITNPPYLSNYSASRKNVYGEVKVYFENSKYDDLYLIALDRMLEAQDYVVAIIPETFINSNYKNKNRLKSITILEDNPFEDTDTPVLVACFDARNKSLQEVDVFKNDNYVNNLNAIENMRLLPNKNVKMVFNDKKGWLAVRCVDTTDPNDMLRFDFKENIDYDWENCIKVSSRLLTLIQIDVPNDKRQAFINKCNSILNDTREKCSDIIFSPFKGNLKDGRRRRRLDFATCRAIIERAYYQTVNASFGGLFYED